MKRSLGIILVVLVAMLSASRARAEQKEQMYSLWLSPSGAEYDVLHRTVCQLAKEYPSHCYMPHVTVVGDIKGTLGDVSGAAQRLASATEPLLASFTGITWEPDDMWRSFYLKVDDTEPFHRLYENVHIATGRYHPWPYHVSLMYTDLPEEPRQALAKSLFGKLPHVVTLDRFRVCTSGDVPEDWKCLVDISLTRPLALPDFTKPPYRLLKTDGRGRGGSFLHPEYDLVFRSIDIYGDMHKQAGDGEEVVNNLVAVFKDDRGKPFYVEWQDYSATTDRVRGYRPADGGKAWKFDKEDAHP